MPIMEAREWLLFMASLGLLGGMRFTSTVAVAAMSIANQDLERYFRSVNTTQSLATEERIAVDVYTYAFLNYTYVENQQIRFINFNEEKARYGEGKILSVHGKLVHISDAEDIKDDTACSSNILGTNGQMTPAYGISWIALVRRGRCTFEEKVNNVFVKGAVGVIIYNDKPVMNLEKMQIKGKSRNITAVITYQDIGLDMAMRLDQGLDVTAHIIEGRSGMRPINSLNRTSVLFVAISFIILMVISLVWLIFYYIQKFRYMQSKDQQSRHLCTVTKKAIMKIPTKTGKSTDEKDADSDCCAICIEVYKASDLIRVLPCKHEFHKSCIDPWLIEHRTCPMCKLDVLKFYGYVVGDEIHTTPSPQHMPANNTVPLDDTDVTVIVVGVAPRQATNTPSTVPSTHHPSSSSSSFASPLSPPAAFSGHLTPSNGRLSATQASVETQTISSLEPHSSHEYDSYCHRRSDAVIPETDEIDHGFDNSGDSRHREDCRSCFQFLGSEESILEYEPDRAPNAANLTDASAPNTSNSRQTGALADLIRSRDFVIDFPRLFVLESGSATGRRDSLFLEGLPERSQSTMSFPQAKDWVFSVANKLEEQHGLRRARKSSHRAEMQEGLLMVQQESVKARRSRSADGRYFVKPCSSEKGTAYETEEAGAVYDCFQSTSRRNSSSSAQAAALPQQALKFDMLNRRIKSKAARRNSVCAGKNTLVADGARTPVEKISQDSPNITITINDDEFDIINTD